MTGKNIFETDGRNLSPTLRERFDTDPAYRQKLVETMQFIDEFRRGRIARARFAEAMTTSDFPGLLGGVIDRTLLGGYRPYPTSYQDWCSIYRDAKDFRELERHFLDLGDGALTKVKELGEAPYANLDEGKYGYKVEKYERKFAFSWEAFINDDLSALTTIPARLGVAAKRTTEKLATSLICDASGPDATFFSDANGNKLTLALNAANLKTAAGVMADLSDKGDEPIFNDPAVLVVPPALKITAQEIVKTIQMEIASGTDTKITTPGLFGNLKVSVAPYISKIITDADVRKKAWFLFADPAQLERPAVEIGFLRGYNEPQLTMKSPDAVPIGGGDLSPFSGDFDRGAIAFKITHVVGGKAMDPRGAVGSFGK